jgi:hypothetical protein
MMNFLNLIKSFLTKESDFQTLIGSKGEIKERTYNRDRSIVKLRRDKREYLCMEKNAKRLEPKDKVKINGKMGDLLIVTKL